MKREILEKLKKELGRRVAITEPNGNMRSLWKHEGDKIIDVVLDVIGKCEKCNGNGKFVGTTLMGDSTLEAINKLHEKFYSEKGDNANLYNSVMTVGEKMIDFADYCINEYAKQKTEELQKEVEKLEKYREFDMQHAFYDFDRGKTFAEQYEQYASKEV